MKSDEMIFSISRDDLRRRLNVIRHGRDGLLNNVTFWRWCDELGYPSRVKRWENAQVQALSQLAELLSNGETMANAVDAVRGQEHA